MSPDLQRARRIAWLTSARDGRPEIALDAWLGRLPEPGDPFLAGVVISRVPPDDGRDPGRRLITRLERASIPWACIDVPGRRLGGGSAWRHDADRSILAAIREVAASDVLMIGHGWWCTALLHAAIRCVNIHPAQPRGTIGTERRVIDALLTSGADRTGLTAHEVGEEHDRGRVVASVSAPLPPRWPGWPRSTIDRLSIVDLHSRLLAGFTVEVMRTMADQVLDVERPAPCVR